MTIGASLFLIAVGAILRWAVADVIDGVALGTVGTILLVVGLVGLVLGLVLHFNDRGDRRPVDRTY
jgi:hypothetical protein